MQKYDLQQTWLWNLQHAPALRPLDSAPSQPHTKPLSDVSPWHWCGLPVASPLGIPAGPLLDARWLLHYAHRGFDVLVYKTVRSTAQDCYPLPNLVPVTTGPLAEPNGIVSATDEMQHSWAVSFGMPSQPPDVWQADVEQARQHLPTGKVLVVSVVGTQNSRITDAERSLEALADDFATCARWAVNSGAHGIEANFSCPNVCTTDGQLYQQPLAAGLVAERIRSQIGQTPLALKIGLVANADDAVRLLQQVGPYINGLAMTNAISARVQDATGQLLFAGQSRGICGDAIREASVQQVRMFRQLSETAEYGLDLIGVGGISKAEHVRLYLEAGAGSVGLATAAMQNPDCGLEILQQLAEA